MPLHVQPSSLRNLSLEQVAHMTFHACVDIETRFGHHWSASVQKEVGDVQEFMLSTIHPLWDEVVQVICEMYMLKESADRSRKIKIDRCLHVLEDNRIYTFLMMHDRMKKIKITDELTDDLQGKFCLGESQTVNLKHIEILDITDIRLTDTMLKTIGNTCNVLNEIHITLCSEDATLKSLDYLLMCKDLQIVDITFQGWSYEQYEPYLVKFLTEMPKLKKCERITTKVLQKVKYVTRLEHLDVTICDENELKNAIPKIPHVQFLFLNLSDTSILKKHKILDVLAESALPLQSLHILSFVYCESLHRVLQLKGANLTALDLEYGTGSETSMQDIWTIGVFCPKLLVISISEYCPDDDENLSFRSRVQSFKPLITKTPPMFCNLEALNLSLKTLWNIQLLLTILFHAKKIKAIVVENLRLSGLRSDILTEILSVNPLIELERLCFQESFHVIVYQHPISSGSLEHLLASCGKLNHLNLSMKLEEDAFRYMSRLECRMQRKNLNLELIFNHQGSMSFFDSDDSSESDYLLNEVGYSSNSDNDSDFLVE